MRLFLFFLLGLSGMARAETLQNLSQNNASPDEIIKKLNEPQVIPTPDEETKEPIQVGTIVSLIRKSPDTPFYEFTVALSDGRVVSVTDANHLSLKPGEAVILTGEEKFWRIKSKISK